MDVVAVFQNNDWPKSRRLFNVATGATMLLTFFVLFLLVGMIGVFNPQYGFSLWQKVAIVIGMLVSFPLCVWVQGRMTFWEICLDAYERKHGLNAEYHAFVDEMKRLGKWPRHF